MMGWRARRAERRLVRERRLTKAGWRQLGGRWIPPPWSSALLALWSFREAVKIQERDEAMRKVGGTT